MDCLTNDQVCDAVAGTMSADERERLDSHIDACGDCREVVSMATVARPEQEVTAERDRIGRYRLDEAIGSGAMGVVCSAFDPELKRKVAIKILHGARDRLRAAARREAEALARLAHPNVVAVHDLGEFEGQPFIAMEYVDGGNLDQWLARARRSWRDVTRVFVQAARGLAAAHQTGLVHRDFKPTNVLIEDGGRVRVADFGLAADTGARGDAGTPAYFAPEQRDGSGATAHSDQYSFCLSLRDAIGAGAPRAIRRIVERGLRERPEERFPDMDAVAAALERTLRPRAPAIAIAATAAMLGAVAIWIAVAAGDRAHPAAVPSPSATDADARALPVAEPAELLAQALDDAARAAVQARMLFGVSASADRDLPLEQRVGKIARETEATTDGCVTAALAGANAIRFTFAPCDLYRASGSFVARYAAADGGLAVEVAPANIVLSGAPLRWRVNGRLTDRADGHRAELTTAMEMRAPLPLRARRHYQIDWPDARPGCSRLTGDWTTTGARQVRRAAVDSMVLCSLRCPEQAALAIDGVTIEVERGQARWRDPAGRSGQFAACD